MANQKHDQKFEHEKRKQTNFFKKKQEKKGSQRERERGTYRRRRGCLGRRLSVTSIVQSLLLVVFFGGCSQNFVSHRYSSSSSSAQHTKAQGNEGVARLTCLLASVSCLGRTPTRGGGVGGVRSSSPSPVNGACPCACVCF
jgi:hypothetical protein